MYFRGTLALISVLLVGLAGAVLLVPVTNGWDNGDFGRYAKAHESMVYTACAAALVCGVLGMIFSTPKKRKFALPTPGYEERRAEKEALDRDAAEFMKRVGGRRFSELTNEEQHEYESLRLREGMMGSDR